MSDNVPIPAGSGTTVATDDVGGVHYQRFKPDLGAADAAAPLVLHDGAGTGICSASGGLGATLASLAGASPDALLPSRRDKYRRMGKVEESVPPALERVAEMVAPLPRSPSA